VPKDDRTEKPTSIRRRKAKEEGQVVQSQQVSSTMSLLFAVGVFAFVLSQRGGFRGLIRRLLEIAINATDSEALLVSAVHEAGVYFLALVIPVLAGAWVGALAGNLVQGLPNFASKALEPKWEKLSPVRGLKNLKAKVSPVEWARVLILLGVLALALWNIVGNYWEDLLRSPGVSIEAENALLRAVVVRLLTYVLIALSALAVVDYFVQRHRHEENLKMTKSEVRQDNKQLEGSPEIKRKVRSIQRDEARKRMMAAVQDADVIITNPTHYAVALQYRPEEMAAPRVVAKGRNWLAKRIKEQGREYDIPQVENVPLARALYRSVDVDQEIPLHLYKAVAEVLAYVFKIRKHQNRKK
jgi:flagellar biosynthetic protein FlhB